MRPAGMVVSRHAGSGDEFALAVDNPLACFALLSEHARHERGDGVCGSGA